MFSALKRLTGKAEGGSNAPRPSHQSMSHSLQKKFARGVQYNMKIIVKGDRNVGKTCLFRRLQGQKFIEEYIPTEEIQVASIQWSYKATDDIVKVEVWDVVDRGKKKKRFDGLKLENSQLEVGEEPALDAEFLDVYKGTNGVIILLDMTKSWTFDYVQRELPKIPPHIPVLVLANHCDMAHHRTVTADHVTYFVESCERPPGSAQVRYAESSMRNGFGLKLLHKFFNLPFLQLQRETLLGQLETNEHEIQLTMQELDLYQESDDADYNKFLDNLMNKRRQAADNTSSATLSVLPTNIGTSAQAFGPASQISHQLPPQSSQAGNINDFSSNVRRSFSMPGPVGAGNPIPGSQPTLITKVVNIPVTSEQNKHPQSSANAGSTAGSSLQCQNFVVQQQVVASPLVGSPSSGGRPDGSAVTGSKSSGFISKIFGKPKDSQEDLQPTHMAQGVASIPTPEPITSVEEFVPDGGVLDRSFLEDTNIHERGTPQQLEAESDSDTEVSNPLVAGFQDDLDPEDALPNIITGTANGEHALDMLQKRKSFSNFESENIIENTKTVESDELRLNGEIAEITADALDTWLRTDSKWRQSPEGGEDSNHSTGLVREDEEEEEDNNKSLASSSVHLELLEPKQAQQRSGGSSPVVHREKKNRHKEKNEDKSTRKYKKKNSKEKDSNKPKNDEKKKKKKSSRKICEDEQEHDELEEFLNGPGMASVDRAYETI